jgi:hypothetical protein
VSAEGLKVIRETQADLSSPLERSVQAFQRWLYLPEPGALLAVLAAVAANRLDGDPVWLLLVGPPGGGKSETITAVASLPEAHACATLTEASLLSGTSRRERTEDSSGGLLKAIGDRGLIIAKDFGSVLSMNRDARALVLAALREIYDGAWTRHVGTDGGRTLHWEGKVGLIGGCTPHIDRHHTVMGAMGERFILYRLPTVDAEKQARRAFAHAGREKQMRKELGEAVSDLFSRGLKEPRNATTDEIERLIQLTTFVVRARSAVERDGYSREIELIPEPEAPTRLMVVLARLLAGLDAIGASRERAWEIVAKAALDSIPATRRAVIDYLQGTSEPVETTVIAEALGYPTNTAKRALEDLTAHGICRRITRGSGRNADTWNLTEFARKRLCNPEMSSYTRKEEEKSSNESGETADEQRDSVPDPTFRDYNEAGVQTTFLDEPEAA